jgi:hypothetical protein
MAKAGALRLVRLFGLVLLAAAGCAGGGWRQMKTKRITGYAETPHRFLETMNQLEYGYAALSAFFPKAQVGNVEVVFFEGTTLAHTFGTNRGGLTFPGVPGAPGIGRGNLILMTEDTRGEQSAGLLSHLFIHQVIPHAPLWLQQGLRQYFETVALQHGDAGWRACFGYKVTLVGTRGTFRMPLDRFFAITWPEYDKSDPWFYLGTATQLMEYIFHADGGAHVAKLPAIFAAAEQGMPGAQIMAATFPGTTLDQLGAAAYDLSRSVESKRRRSKCALPVVLDPSQFPDETEPQLTPTSAQEIDQLLAAVKRLPHGDRYPGWYPPEILGSAKTAAR